MDETKGQLSLSKGSWGVRLECVKHAKGTVYILTVFLRREKGGRRRRAAHQPEPT